MANERRIQIWAEFDPDLVKPVRKTRKEYTDARTGETIRLHRLYT